MTVVPRAEGGQGAPRGAFPAKSKWERGEAAIAWLAATIGPALTFDLVFRLEPALGAMEPPESDMGVRFLAFFQILCTALFLILWARIRRFPLLALIGLAVSATIFFIGYALLRELWTCLYYDEGRVVMGASFLPDAARHLESVGLLDGTCVDQMGEFGGEGARMWSFWSLVGRFLALFGLYALAWWSLALLMLGALFERRKRKKA